MTKQLRKVFSILCAIALLFSSLSMALAEETNPAEDDAARLAAEQAAADEAAAQAAAEAAAAEAAAQAAAEAAAAEAAAQAAAEAAAAEAAAQAAAEAAAAEAAAQAAAEAAAAEAAAQAAAEAAAAEAAAQAAAEAAAQAPAEEPAPAPAAEPAQAPAEEPAPAPAAEPAQAPAEEPAQAPAEEPAPAPAEAQPADENGEDGENDDGLVEIGDDWGYVDPEVISENTPEITDELKGIRYADLSVGQLMSDTLAFDEELIITLKASSAAGAVLKLYAANISSFNTKVDGKAVGFTPAESDDPSMNMYVYELANVSYPHEIVLTSEDTVSFKLAAAAKQADANEESAPQEEVPGEAPEGNTEETAPENGTPAETPGDSTEGKPADQETPAPTVQVSMKTYDALKVGSRISDELIVGQKAKIQVKCGKNPNVTLTLTADPDDVKVTIEGSEAQFTSAGNGVYKAELNNVAFRKFNVTISARRDLTFTLSAEAAQAPEEAAEEITEDSGKTEETEDQPADEAGSEETADSEVTEQAEATEEQPEGENTAENGEETEPSEEEKEEQTEEQTEVSEENEGEETEENTEETAEDEETQQMTSQGYTRIVVTAEAGADLYAEESRESEVTGHLDAEAEIWAALNEDGTWARIFSEDEEAAAQFISMEDASVKVKEETTEETAGTEDEDAQMTAQGYTKVVVTAEEGADLYAEESKESEVTGHLDAEAEAWVILNEDQTWGRIFSEDEEAAAQFISMEDAAVKPAEETEEEPEEEEKEPLTDEQLAELGYRKVPVLNQDGADLYDSTEEEAAVIGHAEFESELWIKDAEAEGWAEIYTEEEAKQFVKLAEIDKQMPSDEEMLAMGYIKVYVAIDIGANVYGSIDGDDIVDHLDADTELWVKLIEGADRALIVDLEENNNARYIYLVDIIATLKPEGMEDLPIRSIVILDNTPERGYYFYGEDVIMTIETQNFLEDDEYTIKWMFSMDNGETFEDAEGACEMTYSYTMEEDKVGCIWKAILTLIPKT